VSVSSQPKRIDSPTCKIDLVKKAAGSKFRSDFDWISDNAEVRVTEAAENRGLTAKEIRELAQEWILAGGLIKCVAETREDYKERRHFHYDIVIENVDEFPRGLYVEMELCNPDKLAPAVNLLNAHPASR
jgi:hypothetical protein